MMVTGLCLGTVIICVALFQDALAVNFCPNGWLSYENNCYKYDTTIVPYWEARRRCQALGADLTTMVNANETEALTRTVQSIPGRVDLWIGLHHPTGAPDHGDATRFQWTDGGAHFDSTYYTHIWFWNEPNQEDQYVRLFRFNGTSPVKLAAAYGENIRKGYVCKKEIWDSRKQHCFGEHCYRISTGKFDNCLTAQQECKKHNMTVLEYGSFPNPLYSTLSLQDIPDDHFWQDYEKRTECHSLSSTEECAANTTARVMCTGPADTTCPCGWIGWNDDCYYLGAELDNTGSIEDAVQHCRMMNASLIEITSHNENVFIGSIVGGSRSYWIRNDNNSMYCRHNADICPNLNVILTNGEWKRSFSLHSTICKKKKNDLRTPTNFCINPYPGECYSFSQTTLTFADLKLTTCGANMDILNEEMLQKRTYLASYLTKAINSPNVTCPTYWINRKDPGIISAKNDITMVSRQVDASLPARYICAKVSDGLCPNDWFMNDNYCYKFDITKVSFMKARVRCHALGGDLATMISANEMESLAREVQSIPGTVDLWIGLYSPTGASTHGDASGFRWTDATDFNSSLDIWYVNEAGEKEPSAGDKFVRFYRYNETQPVKWAAAGADEEKGYICKKEIDECASSPCLNNGTCVDAVNDFGCVCAAGYYGKQCEQDMASLKVIGISSLTALATLAALLGISVTVLACRLRMRKTSSYEVNGNNAEDNEIYCDMTTETGSGNHSMEHSRYVQDDATAGKGIQLTYMNA